MKTSKRFLKEALDGAGLPSVIPNTNDYVQRGDALVIIDMQRMYFDLGEARWRNDKNTSAFSLNNIGWLSRDMIKRQIKVIQSFRKAQKPIIVVEFTTDSGPWDATLPPILRALDGYNKFVTIKKRQIDGSTHVKRAINKFLPKPTKVLVMGIYLSCCVKETVAGLIKKNIDASAIISCSYHTDLLADLNHNPTSHNYRKAFLRGDVLNRSFTYDIEMRLVP